MSRVEDALVLVERLHQRFDDAFDGAEKLSALIAEKIHTGADVTDLMGSSRKPRRRRCLRSRRCGWRVFATASSGYKGGPLSSVSSQSMLQFEANCNETRVDQGPLVR